MNLGALHTTTLVEWSGLLTEDTLTINDEPASTAALQRVRDHLDIAAQAPWY